MKFLPTYDWLQIKNWLSIISEIDDLLRDAYQEREKELILKAKERISFLLEDITEFLNLLAEIND